MLGFRKSRQAVVYLQHLALVTLFLGPYGRPQRRPRFPHRSPTSAIASPRRRRTLRRRGGARDRSGRDIFAGSMGRRPLLTYAKSTYSCLKRTSRAVKPSRAFSASGPPEIHDADDEFVLAVGEHVFVLPEQRTAVVDARSSRSDSSRRFVIARSTAFASAQMAS